MWANMSNRSGTPTCRFANIELQAQGEETVFRKVEEYVESSTYHYQISVNVAKLVRAQKDSRLLRSINEADVVNADGMPIKVIAQLLSGEETKRMGGMDYMDGLAERHPEYRYYFIGATEEVVQAVVAHYQRKYDMNIVGWRNGFFDPAQLSDIVKQINELNTDVLFVALGTPAKEYLLHELRGQLKCKFAVGVGGAFNIVAGKQKRAPKWIQNIGMEWFYRLCQDPGYMWKRYLITNTLFFVLLFKECSRWLLRKIIPCKA